MESSKDRWGVLDYNGPKELFEASELIPRLEQLLETHNVVVVAADKETGDVEVLAPSKLRFNRCRLMLEDGVAVLWKNMTKTDPNAKRKPKD